MVFADALGSLEAISRLFSHEKIPIRFSGVGAPTKQALLEAASVKKNDKELGVVFCFNVPVPDDVKTLAHDEGVKVFEEKIIYNLVLGYENWKREERAAEKKEAFARLATPAKLLVLPGCCFRVNDPAIFGVEVLEGTLKKDVDLMDEAGRVVGSVRAVQKEKKAVDSAKKGEQVAVSVSGPTFGRQVKEKQELFVDVPKHDIETLESRYINSLSPSEQDLLKQVRKIKGLVGAKFS